jgi:hypothetical protein
MIKKSQDIVVDFKLNTKQLKITKKRPKNA